jgi:hypothetical protein
MAPFQARFALIIDAVEARRRRLHIEAIRHLITIKSTLIPLFPRRHRRVLVYRPTEFNLDIYTDEWCIEFLRFSRQEIREIIPFLRLDLCVWRNRYSPTPEEPFCLLLYKLSWLHQLKDTLNIFRRSLS